MDKTLDKQVAIVTGASRGEADAVQAGRAGRDDREVRALQAEHDAQVTRDHVDDRARHEERRNPARATIDVGLVRVFDHRQAADAGTDQHADALRVGFGHFQPAVLDGLDAGGDAVMDERIHVPGFLRRDVLLGAEALHFAREMAGEVRRIELRDGGDTGLAGDEIGPAVGNIIANRRNQPQACNDNTTAAHGNLFSIIG